MGEERSAHAVLVGKQEGKRSLGSSRRKWANNMRINPNGKERDWVDVF
jgi:hypothetical protein